MSAQLSFPDLTCLTGSVPPYHGAKVLEPPNRSVDTNTNTARNLLSQHWPDIPGFLQACSSACSCKERPVAGKVHPAKSQPMSHTSKTVKYCPSNRGLPVSSHGGQPTSGAEGTKPHILLITAPHSLLSRVIPRLDVSVIA